MPEQKRKPGRPPGSKNKQTKEKEEIKLKGSRVRDEICAVILIALGIFLIVAFQTSAAGTVGDGLSTFFKGCFGMAAYILPYYLILYGILLFAKGTIHIGGKAVVLVIVIFFMVVFINSGRFISADGFQYGFGLGEISKYYAEGIKLAGGGLFGMYLGSLIAKLIGIVGLYIFSVLVILICLMLLINTPVSQFFEVRAAKRRAKKEAEEEKKVDEMLKRAETRETSKEKGKRRTDSKAADEELPEKNDLKKPAEFGASETSDSMNAPEEVSRRQKHILEYMKDDNLFDDREEADAAEDEENGTEELTEEGTAAAAVLTSKRKTSKNEPEMLLDEKELNMGGTKGKAYKLPTIDLLSKGQTKRETSGISSSLRTKAQKLEETLQNFHVDAKVVDVTQGPAVTRYEIQPNVGVKVNSIVRLADDIALNMEAKSIRIEAPIPGKKAVGIEIENESVNMVTLRDILSSREFKNAKSKITFAVGRDISGKSIVANLKEMPHLLIAGSTGSGKSVCVNSIITSILYKARPEEVKLILVDPKVVELANYNGIPHLLIPVVTEPAKAAAALNWACAEMDDRYKKFAAEGVRDLESFNQAVKEKKEEESFLPQIVIIIDELADLMMEAPSQVEDSICRLAQKARAAGMHLIVATQRPSVDVITGVIKANIPSRIAFTVSSQFDSRTILDMAGAEKLVGKGDMLFSPIGGNKPVRVQGTFISDDEVHRVIEFVKGQVEETEYSDDVIQSIETVGKPQNQKDEEDELLADAIETVVTSGQASASMLQRRFRIGYNRAARMIDMMEERKIIGPSDGSRPRQVLMTEAELIRLNQETEDIDEDIE